MTTEALKSTSITDLDASPIVRDTAGKGAAGIVRHISDTITPTDAMTVGATYQFVRVPSNCILKHVRVQSAAWTEGDVDFGIYYSDTNDGTPLANQGTVIDSDFFVAAQVMDSIVAMLDITYLNPSNGYTIANSNKQLWDAAGLTTDPGGYFDIVGTTVTSTTSVPTITYVEAEYIE